MTIYARRDLRDLLVRARAALETPADLDDAARSALIEDIAIAEAGIDDVARAVAVALIDSSDGTRFHVATSDALLNREPADWCRPRWGRTGDKRDPALLGDDEIVATYFAGDVSEYFAMGSDRADHYRAMIPFLNPNGNQPAVSLAVRFRESPSD